MYVHESAILEVAEYRDHQLISIMPSLEMMKDEAGVILSRCPAFPGQIGAGVTPKDAECALKDVLTTYIQTFVEENDLEAFENRLRKLGFRPVRSEEAVLEEAGRAGKAWTPWSFKGELVPNIRLSLAACG